MLQIIYNLLRETCDNPFKHGARISGIVALLVTLSLVFNSIAHAETYISLKEGLKLLIPKAERFEKIELELSEQELKQIFSKIGKRFRKNRYEIYEGRTGEKSLGLAMILNVTGKERPITFLVAYEKSYGILGIEVLAFRESQGSEIRHKRFLRQFVGKNSQNKLKLNKNINAISGATLSSRAAVYAASKALAILETYSKRHGD